MVEQPFSLAVPVRSLLVPLDGSRLAEAAVPRAIATASAFGARAILLHVLEAPPAAAVHGEPHLTKHEEAIAYLQSVAGYFAEAGVTVESHVHPNPERNVSASIAAHVEELGIDLIVMANHGSGGLRGFLFGRVAQQVLQSGRRPVLAIPVTRKTPPPSPGIDRLALLLNQTAESESAIPIAIEFAQAFGASIHLISGVPTPGTLPAERSASATLMPGAARELLDLEERNASAYLDTISARLQRYELSVSASVVRGEPASRAVEEAGLAGADLLVMSTHARGGLSGLWSGSIGSKILARAELPLLLVPAI